MCFQWVSLGALYGIRTRVLALRGPRPRSRRRVRRRADANIQLSPNHERGCLANHNVWVIYLRGAGLLVQPTVGQFEAKPRSSNMHATTDSPR
jgi:hypothetical protein